MAVDVSVLLAEIRLRSGRSGKGCRTECLCLPTSVGGQEPQRGVRACCGCTPRSRPMCRRRTGFGRGAVGIEDGGSGRYRVRFASAIRVRVGAFGFRAVEQRTSEHRLTCLVQGSSVGAGQGVQRLAATVILCSGAEGQGRLTKRVLAFAESGGHSKDLEVDSWRCGEERRGGRAQPIRPYGCSRSSESRRTTGEDPSVVVTRPSEL